MEIWLKHGKLCSTYIPTPSKSTMFIQCAMFNTEEEEEENTLFHFFWRLYNDMRRFYKNGMMRLYLVWGGYIDSFWKPCTRPAPLGSRKILNTNYPHKFVNPPPPKKNNPLGWLQWRQLRRKVKKIAISLFFDASGNKSIGATISIGREIECLPYAGFSNSICFCIF